MALLYADEETGGQDRSVTKQSVGASPMSERARPSFLREVTVGVLVAVFATIIVSRLGLDKSPTDRPVEPKASSGPQAVNSVNPKGNEKIQEPEINKERNPVPGRRTPPSKTPGLCKSRCSASG